MDVLLTINNGISDIVVANGDLVKDAGVRTAVVVSLFSDARAKAEQLPTGETAVRGYWSDSQTDRFGSLLWLLRREKMVPSLARKAEDYAKAALKWMVDDGIAASVEVVAELNPPSQLSLSVKVLRGQNKQYSNLWAGVSAPYASIIFSYNNLTGTYEIYE